MPPAPIALDRAYLTAIWLETLLYGMNVICFSFFLFLNFNKPHRRVRLYLILAAVFMFLFSTIHVSLGFDRLIEGFIVLRDQPGGPSAFFSDVSIPANVAKVCIHTVNSVLGDSIVVWRCYIVWGKSWVMCAVPIVLIMASAICGFAQTVYFAQAKHDHSAFSPQLVRWNGSLFSLSLATNVIVSCLIVLRIWYLARQFRGVNWKRGRSVRTLLLIIESGAIYSIALVCEVTLYFLNTNAFYIVYDPIGQLTGIVPTMIIIIVRLGLTSSEETLAARATSTASSATSNQSSLYPGRGAFTGDHKHKPAKPKLSEIRFTEVESLPMRGGGRSGGTVELDTPLEGGGGKEEVELELEEGRFGEREEV